MQGVPRVFEAWTSMASRAQLRHFILNLNIPPSILQPYIVRRIETVTPPLIHVNQDRPVEEVSFKGDVWRVIRTYVVLYYSRWK